MGTGFWKALFRPERLDGAALVYQHAWVVSAPPYPIRLASTFRVLVSDRGFVALEGTSIHRDTEATLQPYTVAPVLAIRPGTLWPKSKWLHLQATSDALKALEHLVNSCAGPEICNHLYAYEAGSLLLEWHDAFNDPISVAGSVEPSKLRDFCLALGVDPPGQQTSAVRAND